MHFISSALIALAVSALVSAAPAVTSDAHRKRAASDILVFKFADVLEQLESAFYAQALQKFQEADFVTAGFSSSKVPIEQFLTIQKDEETHSTVLQAALKSFGESPITSCKFNFEPVLGDVATMAAVARVVENVGVSAYLGGATLLTDPVLLTAAGSILTVEARHQSILNILSSTGTAIPNAFDFALTPSEILALALPFFDGPCDLGIPANTVLSVTNTGPIGPGTKLEFSASTINGTVPRENLFCQMLVGGKSTAIPFPIDACVVPNDINGPVAIFVTSDGQPLVNNVRDRDQIKVLAGPALAFIDTAPQTIGLLARGSNVNVVSSSTTTISPAQASGIIQSGSAAAVSVATSTNVPAASTAGASSTSSAATGAATAAPATNGGAAGAVSGPPSPPTPVIATGPSRDGSITVNGWTA